MNHSLNLPNRFAMILDTEAIKSVIAHAAELNLPRRECHPLDRYRGTYANAVLAKYDAEVDATPLANEDLNMSEAENASVSQDADIVADDF